MRRHILITLLALGTVGGYASGFASLKHRSSPCRRAWMEQRAQPPHAPGPALESRADHGDPRPPHRR